MSKEYPPLSCADVKTILSNLGFKPEKPKGGSHEQWIGNTGGKFRKVTVDCPKAPFTGDLVKWMAQQAGVTKKQFYAARYSEEEGRETT